MPRHRRMIACLIVMAAIVAPGSSAWAQVRQKGMVGVWRVARQAPQPAAIMAISLRRAGIAQAWHGRASKIMPGRRWSQEQRPIDPSRIRLGSIGHKLL